VRAALAAADAGMLVRSALVVPQMERVLRSAAAVDVIAAGKAARPMVLAPLLALEAVPFRHVLGISPHPADGLPPEVKWHVAAHPVPDARSVDAGRAALSIAAGASPRDVILVLLSGGASALMAIPAEGISLQDKQLASQRLLSAGAEVHALNTVRKHLSAIKGGQFAAASGAIVLTLAVSDVVGDDLTAIGSGPTVPDSTTFAEALEAIDRYGGLQAYPVPVIRRLADGAAGALPETPKPGDPRLSQSIARVIGGARSALDGAHAAAESLGYRVRVLAEPITGEARVAAQRFLDAATRISRETPGPGHAAPLCILACGETTVHVKGDGRGGRNQEFSLAMARGFESLGATAVGTSLGTDGIDGPTAAAGGMIDSTTLTRAAAAGLAPPEHYLDRNDSYAFFERLQDHILTGPTTTNVGDVQVILVG
jgi:hydroxypyruvate reductase